jgi:PIN domain nuclease of toxin-antitoxin system
MRLLLDTHALVWWWTDDPRLSAGARKAIRRESNEILVSAASAWELSTKQRLGKLGLPDAVERFGELCAADGFSHLAVSWAHAQRAGTYPQPHRDPFDRMLAAQAELERLTLITADPALAAFPGKRLW